MDIENNKKSHFPQHGFTLIELIVVIAIMGIAASIAIPGFSMWLPNYRLKSATRDLVSTMQLARVRAVEENARVVVTFNTGANSYEAFVDNGEGGGTADNWTKDGGESVVISGTMPPDVTMYEALFAGGSAQVRFDTRGFPNGFGGHVYLRNNKNRYMGVILNAGGNPRIIESTDGINWY